MARGNQNINDQLYRTRSRNAAETRESAEDIRRRQIRSWIILVSVVLAVVLGIHFLGRYGKGKEIGMSKLPCYSNQNVTPFRDGLVYYDGASIHHLSSAGTIRWSFPAGSDVKFAVGPAHLAIWSGTQLFLVDKDGKATYNESMESKVQFARVGERYVAVVVGEDTEPKLIVKDLKGTQVDMEDAFSSLMLLDAGFYGEQGEYLWTLALDVFGTAPNTVMNTFQVGKMNYKEVSLGECLTYKVIYENARLRVFTTQQVYTYDYQGTPESNSTMLVYGWKLIDAEVPERGRAKMLLAPTSQTSSTQLISELRVLEGMNDKRYTLPTTCVGASIYRGNIYAISSDYIYRADVNSTKFFGYQIPAPEGVSVTAFYGITDDGRMLLASGETMYSMTLPER
ncbi:hypothetical protein [Aristaeella lactis]|uniref:Uncharacterized protein n=1 Tax=Aristaeella lactis TaxID=3046383 RepID=A0AC61PNH1_9FIRM|nr:hypothetical protein [Aristaeella lactis]QUA52514.1 hypothetical protein JYE50_12530 [Aristaeella lactis]SMC76625.1 hypothetical protein SAMN06297397_2392 [Aristaeella lactis]